MSLMSAQVSTASASSYGDGQGISPSASAASYDAGQGISPNASAASDSLDSSDSLDYDTVTGESPAMVPLAQQAVRRVVRVSSRSVSSRLSSSRSASSASARSWTTSSPVPAKPVFPAVGWFVKGIWCPLPPKVELTLSSSGYMDRGAEHRRPIVPAVPSKGFPPGWTPHAHLPAGIPHIERQPVPSVQSWLLDRVHGDAPGYPGNPNRAFPFPPGSVTDSTRSSGVSDLSASQLGAPDNRNPWFDLVHSATQSKATFEKDVDSLVVDCWTDLARKVRLTRAQRQLEDVHRSTALYQVFTKHIPRVKATRQMGMGRQAWPSLINHVRQYRAADIADQVLSQPQAELWDYRPPSTRLPKCIDDAFASWDAREDPDIAMPFEEVMKAKEHLDNAFDGWSAIGDVSVSLGFEAKFAGMDFDFPSDDSEQEQEQEPDLETDDSTDTHSIPDAMSLPTSAERIAHWKKYDSDVDRRVDAWQRAKGAALLRMPVLAPLPTDTPSPEKAPVTDSSIPYADDMWWATPFDRTVIEPLEERPFNDPLLEKVRLWQLSKGDALFRAPVLAPLPDDTPLPPATEEGSSDKIDSEPQGEDEASEEDSFASAQSTLLTEGSAPVSTSCSPDTPLTPGSFPEDGFDIDVAPVRSAQRSLPSWSTVGKVCLGAAALALGVVSGWFLSGSC
ncbi:hypothetical protein D7B24_007593 [Verticillium nonalfalfae]|uniref:Uncharacterized protein n=1 Tax=Verticillium nonalfalfae TaxID=1051616 RepID=A0A3M9YAU9_9PEZI|nr:uncharacterized protein D7B24_007593 [Verticillium nonalfalfae]RNJ56210.1 hypothetical protein D7B24_007593 [Verticillium nonalfalfae]